MPKSRYTNTEVIDGNHYATFTMPSFAKGYRAFDLLQGVAYEEYIWKRGDRFDKLAALRLNDENYWWIICLCNDIIYPSGIEASTVIKIPLEINDVLRRLLP